MSKDLNILIAITKAIRDRIAAQGVTGPKRQASMALEMLVGACAVLDAVGKREEFRSVSMLAFLVSTRGMEGLK